LKTLIPVRCVIVDIIETMAAMLVNDDVVLGRKGQHFHFEYCEEFNEDGEQTFGNVTSTSSVLYVAIIKIIPFNFKLFILSFYTFL
jgi:hypothetical protein